MFKCITWNCEGFKRVSIDLLQICYDYDPDFLFLSEPLLFQSYLILATALFNPLNCSSLSSADKIDPLIAFTTNHAHGGTLIFWKRSLDPFVTIVDVNSSSFIILILKIPGFQVTIRIFIYTPTIGKENQFVQELYNLEIAVEEIFDKYPSATAFIRGDTNSTFKPRPGIKRDSLLSFICEKLGFSSIDIGHRTYHHFIGNTSSSIVVILQKSIGSSFEPEKVFEVLCSKETVQVDSKHDIIMSGFSLPYLPPPPVKTWDTLPPEVPNTRHKIHWSDDNIQPYRNLLQCTLSDLQANWSSPSPPASFSFLLQATNKALTSAVKATNKLISLSEEKKVSKKNAPLTSLKPQIGS